MSKYVIYYNVKKSMYQELAFAWKTWSENACLTETQTAGMSLFFKHLGRRFGLIRTFREIGVI